MTITGRRPHRPRGKGVVAPPDLPPALAALDLHRQLAHPRQDLPLPVDGQLDAAPQDPTLPSPLVLVLRAAPPAAVAVRRRRPPLIRRRQPREQVPHVRVMPLQLVKQQRALVHEIGERARP